MKKVKLIVNYDGTDFKGFQYQPDIRTVQGVLEEGISKLTNESIRIIGSSRTDAGVHANGQVITFWTDSSIPEDKYSVALKKHLPEDIDVIKSVRAADDFHPIANAYAKRYSYLISGNKYVDIRKKRFCYHLGQKLDIIRINEACSVLIGTKDFKSFCASGSQSKTTVRTIYSAKIIEDKPNEYNFTIIGNGFLYKMVRIIVGSLIEVGLGKLSANELEDIIKVKDRKLAPMTAPSQGLCLDKVWYSKEFLPKELDE
ncbi:MAG: tRNA pseudouridine(38-40) synthase TruA [Clostridia bacterium]